MDILPARIQPYQRTIPRKHKPDAAASPRGYREYRRCLRWEFGFTCAMCLLHEGDFSDTGVKGTGQMGVEHLEPQSSAAGRSSEYENCLYVCRYCNIARSNRPSVNRNGQRLLNPTSAVWAAHFSADGDRLTPVPGDADAAYTHDAYRLDAPRKILMRQVRRQNIEYCLRTLQEGPALRRKLLSKAAKLEASADKASALRAAAAHILANILRAWQELQRYRAVPGDHDCTCRCAPHMTLRIPDALEEQVVRVIAPAEVLESG